MIVNFNNLPEAVNRLDEKLSRIENLLSQQEPQSGDIWLDLNELVAYDPEKRSKPTFYAYVQKDQIPYYKRGKKLIFLKSEIDAWLKTGRKKTVSEIEAEADSLTRKS